MEKMKGITFDIRRKLWPIFCQQQDIYSKSFNILRAYAQYDKEVGYIQGMSFIVKAILMHLHPENDKEFPDIYFLDSTYERIAFWIFYYIMYEKQWRVLFLDGQPGLYEILNKFKKKMEQNLSKIHEHIIGFEVLDMLLTIKELNLKKENFQLVQVSNAEGDYNLKDPLYQIGGVGLFTKQVENELINNNADIAVHSLKDLPTIIDEKLYIGAVPHLKKRSDIVIISEKNSEKTLQTLPEGSIIGTSSLRRVNSLKYRFPHLKFENIRGNLNTRLNKLKTGQYNAIILAYAGVERLGWTDKITQVLDEKEYFYAPGQAALGIQCRKDDILSIKMLQYINNREAQIRVEAERQFLNSLEGGCKLPIAVYSELNGEKLLLKGQVWDNNATYTIKDGFFYLNLFYFVFFKRNRRKYQ
ncbi:porphobilinogen deaminase, putative [Ichthyophthirius multifiliis]|uniref:hydroxymethylbilane synthase n=1 Tax=Ichthyophthirius multifiliis TaxID=5932 RepID=G0QW27_ICHMU|nr:porphobilinogen deaminase, putative [Ichthyophthirius multifiliis]EGR30579.1 porphobilinogen deaminase, putative [Ichthyophthirius multifiliis]|eukprot:XP_004032166.1 porphobilinogen deaminase, putative [Ichthyophthirius multifiliis]